MKRVTMITRPGSGRGKDRCILVVAVPIYNLVIAVPILFFPSVPLPSFLAENRGNSVKGFGI